MLIDSHCHIQFKAYDENRDEVIRRARHEGVRMIAVGSGRASSEAAVRIAASHDDVWAAVGLHPNHLFAYPIDTDEEAILSVEHFDPEIYRALAAHKKVVAIGECGLDYYRIPDNLDHAEVRIEQEKFFRAQLDLADELKLPVIIHCRDAHADVARILKEYLDNGKLARRGVIHCFTGTIAEANVYTLLGFYISFTGIITFPPRKGQTETLADVVRAVPLDRILVETDAPYLAPVPHRGKQNEPTYVKFVAEKIAEIKGMSADDVATQTVKNTEQLFRLS